MTTRRNKNYRPKRLINKYTRNLDRNDPELNKLLSNIHLGIAGSRPSRADDELYIPYSGTQFRGRKHWRYIVKQARQWINANFVVQLTADDTQTLRETGTLSQQQITMYVRNLQTKLATERVFRITDVDLSGQWTPSSVARRNRAYFVVTYLADESIQLIQLSPSD